MPLYLLPCPQCHSYSYIREVDVQQVGQLGIVCEEHGVTPLFTKDTDIEGNTQYIPLTWADLLEEGNDDDAL